MLFPLDHNTPQKIKKFLFFSSANRSKVRGPDFTITTRGTRTPSWAIIQDKEISSSQRDSVDMVSINLFDLLCSRWGSSVAEQSKALYTGSRGRGFESWSFLFSFSNSSLAYDSRRLKKEEPLGPLESIRLTLDVRVR